MRIQSLWKVENQVLYFPMVPILPKYCLVPKHSKNKPGFAKEQKNILWAFVIATYSPSQLECFILISQFQV